MDFGDPPHEPEWSPPTLREAFGLWRTRDDRVLRIAEMETLHIRNAVTMFTRFGYGDCAKFDELRAELERRADAPFTNTNPEGGVGS